MNGKTLTIHRFTTKIFIMLKKIFLLLFLLPILFFSQYTAKVIGIKDGDTIVVLLEGKTQKTLRLAEVDCPESAQPFGKNAKQFTSSQVFGKEVNYWETDTDRYGRTIAKVFYDDGKYLSAEIIRNGFGWWYHWFSTDKRLRNLEIEAKKNNLGLWADRKAVSPWEWRKQN